jgi:hypothetical protein
MSEEEKKDYAESPINLEYHYTAGSATTRFLNQVKEGKIVGQSCPKCSAVYVPPRGSCPRCGVATNIEVPLTDKGCIESFTIVHIPIPGNPIVPPYVCAIVNDSMQPLSVNGTSIFVATPHLGQLPLGGT